VLGVTSVWSTANHKLYVVAKDWDWQMSRLSVWLWHYPALRGQTGYCQGYDITQHFEDWNWQVSKFSAWFWHYPTLKKIRLKKDSANVLYILWTILTLAMLGSPMSNRKVL